jgi:hypothetical protein
MNKSNISKGSSVYFDIGHGTQSGTVIDLLPDISNGRQHASIELDQRVPGIATVPVDQLSITKDVSNFIFLSGHVDNLSLKSTDRRFYSYQPTAKVPA